MDVVECEELLLVGDVAAVGEVQVGQGVEGQGQRGEREGEQDQLLQNGEHSFSYPLLLIQSLQLQAIHQFSKSP